MPQNQRNRSLVWPLILICIGILFLLYNLGVISWSIWSMLWRLWPVLLVAIGLDLIFGRRSGVWSGIIAFIMIILFAGVFWLFGITETIWSGDKINSTVVHELSQVEDGEVQIKMQVGSIRIGALPPNSSFLIVGDIELSEFENLRDEFQISGDSLYYKLSSDGQQYHPEWILNQNEDLDKNWDLLLNQDLQLDLRIENGVGKSEINLSDINLSGLDIRGGVGEITIYMPSKGNFKANIKSGVGKLVVYLPSNLPAQIKIDNGLGNVSILGDFTQKNGRYFTQNYKSSSDFVGLIVDGGVGNIRIIQIEE